MGINLDILGVCWIRGYEGVGVLFIFFFWVVVVVRLLKWVDFVSV